MPSEPCPSNESDRKDIVFIGAGVVGLSCALWLLRSGSRVPVVDREPPSASTDYRHAGSYGDACTIALGACLPVASPGILCRLPGMLLDRDGPPSIYWHDLPALAPWLYHFLRTSGKRPVEEIVAVLGEMLCLAEEGHASLIAEANVRDLVRRHGCMYVYRTPTERGYHIEFETDRPLLHSSTCYPSAGFYMVPLSQGLRAAGTVDLGGRDKPFRKVRTAVIERRARFFLPALGTKTSDWLGFRPSMPDSIPVIGRSSVGPEVLYAFEHGDIGLTLAGITGSIVCDLVNGDTLPIDLSPLRPNRY